MLCFVLPLAHLPICFRYFAVLQLKQAAEVSMGTEIAEDDIKNIKELCEQVRDRGVVFFV